jgi:hypothetical protein
MDATWFALFLLLGYACRVKLAIRLREDSQPVDIEGYENHNR